MADPQHGEHNGTLFRLYMIIAVVLSVCTASSFLVNYLVRENTLTHVMGFVLILGVAIIKATLVGIYFMHLKWDWKLLYIIIIPAFVLAVMWAIVLMPDTFVGPMSEGEAAKFGDEFSRRLQKSN